VKFRDYYETLGVSRSASDDEIKKAYRKLAREFHPDINKATDAEEKFKQVNEAYEVLKDPEKRKRFDALGANWQDGQDFTPPPGFESFFGGGHPGGGGGGTMSDFFESLFGSFGGGGGRGGGFGGFGQRQHAGPQRGADQEATLTITIEEAALTAKKNVSLRAPDGSTKSYDVRIPPGVAQDSRIRLAGQGAPGPSGGPPGDLLLRIAVARHAVYRVNGSDLEMDVCLAPWEAALGTKVEVPTPDGPVTLTVQPGTSGGQKLRLRGRGLPKSSSDRGHLYAITRIVVPEELSNGERKLFEKLAKESKFRPRG